jgi:hypothetical protein
MFPGRAFQVYEISPFSELSFLNYLRPANFGNMAWSCYWMLTIRLHLGIHAKPKLVLHLARIYAPVAQLDDGQEAQVSRETGCRERQEHVAQGAAN